MSEPKTSKTNNTLCGWCGREIPDNGVSVYCPECRDIIDEVLTEQRRKNLVKIIAYNKEHSGLHRRMQVKTFHNFIAETKEQKAVLASAMRYCSHFQEYAKDGIGLILEGTNGTGKTHITAAIANALLNQGVRVICNSVNTMLSGIRASYVGSGESEEAALSPLVNCGLLIIDDIGKQQSTEWATTMLFNVINERYERNKPTIFTTNYNIADLEKAFHFKGSDGETERAIISRIKELSTPLTMPWEDYRDKIWRGISEVN